MASVLALASGVASLASYVKQRRSPDTPDGTAAAAPDPRIDVVVQGGSAMGNIHLKAAPEPSGIASHPDAARHRKHPYRQQYNESMRADLDESAMQHYYDTRELRRGEWSQYDHRSDEYYVSPQNPRSAYSKGTVYNDPRPHPRVHLS